VEEGLADEGLAEVVAPLQGTVTAIERAVGRRVDPGSAVATLATATTRVAVQAGVAGVVEDVRAVVGATVEPGDVLVVVNVGPDGLTALDEVDVDAEMGLEDEEGVGAPLSEPTVCTHCGWRDLEPGFIEDRGQGSGGYGRWVEGQLELGIFGGARKMGRRRRDIEAYRCGRCGHLELFAPADMWP
jgi:hypothetical protein